MAKITDPIEVGFPNPFVQWTFAVHRASAGPYNPPPPLPPSGYSGGTWVLQDIVPNPHGGNYVKWEYRPSPNEQERYRNACYGLELARSALFEALWRLDIEHPNILDCKHTWDVVKVLHDALRASTDEAHAKGEIE